MSGPSRKDLLTAIFASAVTATLPVSSFAQSSSSNPGITLEDLKAAQKALGVAFSDEELKAILTTVIQQRREADALAGKGLENGLESATRFVPLGVPPVRPGKVTARAERVAMPKSVADEDLAFATIPELGALLRAKKVTSRKLTELALARLRRFDPILHCVINLTEKRALAAADLADEELARGKDRGPLHGIPYGLKDLFDADGTPTTWGAAPYKDRVGKEDAAVVRKLEAAGAVLVAKLSCGALAMDDTWFGGKTRNPWNPEQGSSGSSAGSASAVAAGLVPFAIGTETLGSIVSPSIRCRTTGLRPTYGRSSRGGGMVLAQTMDKVGPICRTAEDAALILAAIAGSDPGDPSAVDAPFVYPPALDFKKLKVGVLVARKDQALPSNPVTKFLESKGVKLVPIAFSALPPGATNLLDAESAAFFDGLTRDDAEIAKLTNSLWPNIFRTARFMSAVDYINAQRMRTQTCKTFEAEFGELDFFVCNGSGYTLTHTNLTGHPQLVIPQIDGTCVSLVGRLYREDVLCAVGWQAQKALGAHRLRPSLKL